MTRPRIVIAEEIAEPGLERLRNAGFEVDIQLEKSPEDLRQCIVGADRSARSHPLSSRLRL